MLPQPFIAAQYVAQKPITEGGILPPGLLPVEITSVEVADTQTLNSQGQPMKKVTIALSVCEGEHRGSRGNVNLNLGHEVEKARQIAWETLAKIVYCVGLENQNIQNLDVLRGRKLLVWVVPQMVDGAPHPKGYTEIPTDGYETLEGHKPYLPGGGIGKGRLHTLPKPMSQAPVAAPMTPSPTPTDAWSAPPAAAPAAPAANPADAWGAPTAGANAGGWG